MDRQNDSSRSATLKLYGQSIAVDSLEKESRDMNDRSIEQNIATSQSISRKAARLDRIKVLFVEDSVENQQLVKLALEHRGALVNCADNGADGVYMAEHDEYDVVLMDIQMPVLNGYLAAQALREDGFKKPIIALTTSSQVEDREKSKQAGFDAHLTKPIDLNLLVNTIVSFTGVTGGTDELLNKAVLMLS